MKIVEIKYTERWANKEEWYYACHLPGCTKESLPDGYICPWCGLELLLPIRQKELT